jgi:hypothetical protein
VRRSILTLGSLLAGLGIAAPAAQAGTVVPCGDRTVSQPFTPWGDDNNYFSAPDGTFENGLGGWYGYGVGLSSENEPWSVFGSDDSSSVRLTSHSVKSPVFCVAAGEEAVRLFVKRPGVANSELDIRILAIQPSTSTYASNGISIDGDDPGWIVTDPIPVPSLFGTIGNENLSIRIDPDGAAATWLVDDVAVDPWKG